MSPEASFNIFRSATPMREDCFAWPGFSTVRTVNVDPTAESGPDGEPRRELRRQCSNYIARRIQRLSSRLSTPEKGTSHHHVSVCSCLRHASSNDPPLACRHRDGCCDGSVPLPEDPRRWRANRHTNYVWIGRELTLDSYCSDSRRLAVSRGNFLTSV